MVDSTNNTQAQINEKTGLFHRNGMRKARRPRRRAQETEDTKVTAMGSFYRKILNFSTATRYLLYIVPLGILLAVPVVIGASAAKGATIGDVRIVWFFVWLECCWAGLWISKIFAHWLPNIFQFLCGIVSSGTRKYALVLKALEIPISIVGWALVALATFRPLMTRNPDSRASNEPTPHWVDVVERILAAALISSIIMLAERLLIQLLSINYHRKQFAQKISDSKHHVQLLSLLYESSRAMFPQWCEEFAEEDAAISDEFGVSSKGRGHLRSGSLTPMKLMRNVGRFGDKVTSVFGNVAQEVTGKQILNPGSSHSVVVEALEKNRSAEALARRLWLSFVVEGNEALYEEDIIEVLGAGRQAEAEECFQEIDRDANGDVSLDEMILTVIEWSRERNSVAKSMHDVDQAINVLDQMLSVVVFIVIAFVFIAWLNTSFVTTLATAGTALLSLSFVFSATAQEILGSCIFIFSKHPIDVGDRVTIGKDELVVEHISLLFTIFRRVNNHRTVQIPNIVLNTLWIENVSRSKAMREQVSIFVAADTTLEDIQLLRNEMSKFAADKENARDFQSNVEIEVVDIHEMDKLELQIDILHKSNWANETVRAARRSKFMCALILALRKVPIYGPGGGDPALGSSGNPSYSVAIPDSEAAAKRGEAAEAKEGKRLVPSKAAEPKTDYQLGPSSEAKVVEMLNERSPALDGTRDYGSSRDNGTMDPDRVGSQNTELEEVRGLLRRQTTKGKRKSDRSSDPMHTSLGPISQLPHINTSVPQVGVTAPSPSSVSAGYLRSVPSQESWPTETRDSDQSAMRKFPAPPTSTAYQSPYSRAV